MPVCLLAWGRLAAREQNRSCDITICTSDKRQRRNRRTSVFGNSIQTLSQNLIAIIRTNREKTRRQPRDVEKNNCKWHAHTMNTIFRALWKAHSDKKWCVLRGWRADGEICCHSMPPTKKKKTRNQRSHAQQQRLSCRKNACTHTYTQRYFIHAHMPNRNFVSDEYLHRKWPIAELNEKKRP